MKRVLFEFNSMKFDSKISSLDSISIQMLAKSLQKVFFAGTVVLLTACASKPASVQLAYIANPRLEPITQTTDGTYCTTIAGEIFGGAGIAHSTMTSQHSLGKCTHPRWGNEDISIIDFGEDAVQQAEEMHLLQPVETTFPVNAASSVQVALTTEEIAERDCTPVSNCHIALTLNNQGVVIHFTSDSDVLNNEDLTQIRMLAQFAAKKQLQLVVVGHTDSTASEHHNKTLSIRRAQAVAKALQLYGVSAQLIASQGMSSTQAVTSNDTPDGRALNRRVVIQANQSLGSISHGN